MIPFSVLTNRPVWFFAEPSLDSAQVGVAPQGEPLSVIAYDEPWLLVEWTADTGPQQGWVSLTWVEFVGTPPPDFPAIP